MIYFIVAARSGSKGLRNKNVIPFGNSTLLDIAISKALALADMYLGQAVLTTDILDIDPVHLTNPNLILIRRAPSLCTDTASTINVVLDVMHRLSSNAASDYFVLIPPTGPLVPLESIQALITKVLDCSSPSGLHITEIGYPADWLLSLDTEGRLSPIYPNGLRKKSRQMCTPAYRPAGTCYVWNNESLSRCLTSDLLPHSDSVFHVINREEAVNIDSISDFNYAESLFLRK